MDEKGEWLSYSFIVFLNLMDDVHIIPPLFGEARDDGVFPTWIQEKEVDKKVANQQRDLLLAIRNKDFAIVREQWSKLKAALENKAVSIHPRTALAWIHLRKAMDEEDSKPHHKDLKPGQYRGYTGLQRDLPKFDATQLVGLREAIRQDQEHLIMAQVDRRAKQLKYRVNSEFWMSDSSSGRSSGSDGPEQTYLMPWEPRGTINTTVDFKAGIVSIEERLAEVRNAPFIGTIHVKPNETEFVYPFTLDADDKAYADLYDNKPGKLRPIPGLDYSKVGHAVDTSKPYYEIPLLTCTICTCALRGTYYHCLNCDERVLLCEPCEEIQCTCPGHTSEHVLAKIRPTGKD